MAKQRIRCHDMDALPEHCHTRDSSSCTCGYRSRFEPSCSSRECQCSENASHVVTSYALLGLPYTLFALTAVEAYQLLAVSEQRLPLLLHADDVQQERRVVTATGAGLWYRIAAGEADGSV